MANATGKAQSMSSLHDLAVAGLIAFGLVQTFFGYRLFRILIGVIGALIGYYYAPQIVLHATGNTPSAAVSVLAGVGLAVAFALVAWYVFRFAVFAWGSALGFVAGIAAFGLQPWIAVLIGLLVGALALLFQRVLVVLLTAVHGAWLAVSGIAFFIGRIASQPRGPAFDPMFDMDQPHSVLLLIISLVLAVMGSIYQFRDPGPMFGRKIDEKTP